MAIQDIKAPDDNKIPLDRLPGLYISPDTPKGRAVLTTSPIPAGTLLETCPVLPLSPDESVAHTSLHHYTYVWPPGKTQAVVFGLGSMFNHSSRDQNVGWKRDLQRGVVVYWALRDIGAGEELCISYGERLTFVDADADADDEDVANESEGEMLGRIELDT